MKIFGIVIAGLLGVLALTTVLGSWYTIDQRERGVILRNGAVTGIAEPGLHFKLPFFESVVEIPLETFTITYDKLPAYSRDQQPADIAISVIMGVTPSSVIDLYSRFGSLQAVVDRLVTPKVNEQLKNVFGSFNAVTAIQERSRLNAEVAAAVQREVANLNAPVSIESVQIENIDFSDAYENSIEQRMVAEVEVQKMRQNAEREKVQAQIVVTQAQAKADAVRAEAQAQAEATKLNGEAEALAIKARGDALRDNPGLVALTQAERWNGILPQTMLPDGAVPMLSLKAQ